MQTPTGHTPVMLQEVLEYLSPKEGEVYIDGTFGAGGYSRALLESSHCCLYAIDRDPDAAPLATMMEKEFPGRFTFVPGAFGDMDRLMEERAVGQVNGIVLDIGVSSMQLDRPERGFSFASDGPLDMRMSQEGRDASELVNSADEKELADILYYYGDERRSRRIARAIVEERKKGPITRTMQLAAIIHAAIGKRDGKIDAATKSFQALRIWVNDELGELERALRAAEKLLLPGGRLVIVSFHSLEDVIVKRFLHEKSGKKENVSRHVVMRVAEEAERPLFSLLKTGVVKPTEQEININPRARSSRLRAAKRTDVLCSPGNRYIS